LLIDGRYLFVEVDVSLIEAKIKVSDYFNGAAPVKIVNDFPVPVDYGQKDVTQFESEKRVFTLLPHEEVYFCWPDPTKPRKLVYRYKVPKMAPVEDEIDLEYDQAKMFDPSYVITFLDKKQRMLLFTCDKELPSYLLNVS